MIFIKNCSVVLLLLCFVYICSVAWASSVQTAVYSQDIPPNMICIKDTVPNAYLCSPDATVPWYLSSEGVLAHVK
jgi:hypothetical protein